MRLGEVRELVGPRPPRLGTAGVLDRCQDIGDLRSAARRRLPRAVFDYVDGGADEELTLAANEAAFRRFRLRPRALTDVSAPDLSVSLFGSRVPLPLALAPTGYTRMVAPEGEPAVARAAAARGIPYTLSTVGTSTIEDVAAVGHQELWFQLYVLKDRSLAYSLVDRAAAAGYRVLEIAVDTAVAGHRSRDVRSGLTIPPRLSARTVVGIGARPRYWTAMLRGAPLEVVNLREAGGSVAAITEQFDPAVTWDDVEEIRRRWQGALVLKGPLGPADVRRALDAGVDGVHLSNHGGRQLDRCVPAIDLVRPAREAAGAAVPLLVDSGVRHGADIAVALALGADACLIGRPYLYGLAAGGEPGVGRAIDLLTAQFRRTLQLLGVSSAADLRTHGTELITHD